MFRRLPAALQIGVIVGVVALLIVAGFLALRQYQGSGAVTNTELASTATVDVGGASQTVIQSETPQGILVVGEAEIPVTPDLAIVSLGVEVTATAASEASSQASAAATAVIAAVKSAGVEPRDIKTTGLSLRPIYPPIEPQGAAATPPKPVAYQATNTLSITIRKVGDTSAVLDAGLGAGTNVVHAIAFTVADPVAAKKAALRLATIDAASKAQAIAEALSGRLKGLISITEEAVFVPRGGVATVAVERAGTVPVEADELRVRATVRANFQFE